MTTELLPPVISSPFSRRFDTNPYSLRETASLRTPLPSASDPAIHTFIFQRPRQTSPASILSIASAPLPTNDENVALLCHHPDFSHSSLQTVSSMLVASAQCKTEKDGGSESIPSKSMVEVPRLRSFSNDRSECGIEDPSLLKEDTSILRNALKGIEKYKFSKTGRIPPANPKITTDCESQYQHCNNSIGGNSNKVGTALSLEDGYPTTDTALTPRNASTEINAVVMTGSDETSRGHRKRLSTNSSGFVHTVKTASFSNGSFSVLSKSLHLGRSSETRALFTSHSRFSTDSDRPSTNHSVDEAALRRSVKRRQILEELVVTEETYTADLKALVYLMSTLLASANSIPSRLRHSMQQNVLDLLHLHEQVLEQLNRAAFKAAARKWADAISPRGLASPRYVRWRTLEPSAASRLARVHRRTRSSIDSNDLSWTRARLVGADPDDITEITSIFKDSVATFFAYEEYCANHEIIAHDLQTHLPTLWSTCEAGMESLARSLVSIERQGEDSRKAITVGDLLIKPIQRICKYPLLFEDLLKQTPVSDCPAAHVEVDAILQEFRDVADAVNHATHSQETRVHIHRRWALQARLNFGRLSLASEDLRSLGNAVLCGVLHVTYQTRNRVDGAYALCILYRTAFLVAFPAGPSGKFDATAFINLTDLKLESASDGKGLQSPSALHTWKICFAIEGSLHEFILSACSVVEEGQWKLGLLGEFVPSLREDKVSQVTQSSIALELKSVGIVYGHNGSLARRLSVQRAATVGNRASICQVIVRNTHNPEELHEFRQPSTSSINRSHSHMTTHRVVVLAPKRSDRARLESILADVWTKDKLPFPGMIASRGGQIIRASAGSLVRKLSLASIHAPFSRRSASLTVSSRKSYKTFSDMNRTRERIVPTFEIRRDSVDDRATPKPLKKTSHDLPELDTMDRVVNRMIGDTKSPSFLPNDGLKRKGTLRKQSIQMTALPVGPDDSAEVFYPEQVDKTEKQAGLEEALGGSKKKRWSNPFGLLKGLSAEGFRHMLYSTK